MNTALLECQCTRWRRPRGCLFWDLQFAAVTYKRYSTHEQDLPPCVKWATPTNWIGMKDFSKGTFDLERPKLNVLIRDKILFVGVAHLTRGGRFFLRALYRRSCSWALYRYVFARRCHFDVAATWQVIFRKRATNNRALLQKITSKDKVSYGSSPRFKASWSRRSTERMGGQDPEDALISDWTFKKTSDLRSDILTRHPIRDCT